MNRAGLAFVLPLAGVLSGCVSTVAHVVTAPVRIADKAVDWTTTSQSEADRNRGRALRHREERQGRLDRAYRDSSRACEQGDRSACERARVLYDQLNAASY